MLLGVRSNSGPRFFAPQPLLGARFSSFGTCRQPFFELARPHILLLQRFPGVRSVVKQIGRSQPLSVRCGWSAAGGRQGRGPSVLRPADVVLSESFVILGEAKDTSARQNTSKLVFALAYSYLWLRPRYSVSAKCK